MQESTSERK